MFTPAGAIVTIKEIKKCELGGTKYSMMAGAYAQKDEQGKIQQ